jgi:hypothetical protein
MDLSYYQHPKIPDIISIRTIPKYYVYLYHVIIKKGNQYYISYARDAYSVIVPIEFEGEIVNMYAMVESSGYLCTDKNTYYISRSNEVTVCNCVCTRAVMGKHYMILYTNDHRVIYYINNAEQNSIPLSLDDVKIVGNCLRMPGHEVLKHCIGDLMIKDNPDQMYSINSVGWVFTTPSTDILYIMDDLNRISKLPSIAYTRAIADYGVNSKFSNQNIYFIDDMNKIHILEKNIVTISNYTYFYRWLCTFEGDTKEITKIISLGDYLIVFGLTFVHAYGKVKTQCDKIIVKWRFPLGANVEFDTNIFGTRFVLKYGSEFIIIGPNVVTENKLITLSPFTIFQIPGITSTLVSALRQDTTLYHSNGLFIVLDHQTQLVTEATGKNILGSVVRFNQVDAMIETESNVFNQYLLTLVSLNFKSQLCASLSHQGHQISYGPGARRDIHQRITDYIKSNLFTDSTGLYGKVINNSNPFWYPSHKTNNAYYFGKFLAYLCHNKNQLNFHIDLSILYAIHSIICEIISHGQSLSINELAAFHNEFFPTDYKSMVCLDDNYKRDAQAFRDLALSYDSFEQCIYDKLKIDIAVRQDPLIQEIARGIYDYNPLMCASSLWSLDKMLSGDFKYDRDGVMNNFVYVSLYKYNDALNKMKQFILDLSDEELTKFMITVTGYHIRDCKVNIHVVGEIGSGDNKKDIDIKTCSDRISIASHVFDRDDYVPVLKAYLCSRDIGIRD